MDTKSLFEGTIQIAERALDLRSRRHELILSNIANADTPNYKAFDLYVEEALANQAPGQVGGIELKQTDSKHMSVGGGAVTYDVGPYQLELSTRATLRGDGNTVDMEREMSSLASNQLQYKASAQILAKKFQGLRNVIQGGKG